MCLGRSMYICKGRGQTGRAVYGFWFQNHSEFRILVSDQYLGSTNQDSVFTSWGREGTGHASYPYSFAESF